MNMSTLSILSFCMCLGFSQFSLSNEQIDTHVISKHVISKTSVPLLVKTHYPGFVLPENAIQKTCSVYLKQTIIDTAYGFDSLKTKQLIRHFIGYSIYDFLEQSQDEKIIEEPNFLCDAASSTIMAYDQNEPVLLFNTGGCGTPRQERTGPVSTLLINLVNQICP